jgi:hypothetical protein
MTTLMESSNDHSLSFVRRFIAIISHLSLLELLLRFIIVANYFEEQSEKSR